MHIKFNKKHKIKKIYTINLHKIKKIYTINFYVNDLV
jgi:hypothetical protein